MKSKHVSVLHKEAVEALHIQEGKYYVDATFGRGGHTRSIIKKGGKVIAFDVDHEAIAYGKQTFQQEIQKENLKLVRKNFEYLSSTLQELDVKEVAGVLFDFGTTVDQLTSEERGFSFDKESELDMRMDTRLGVTAKDLLAVLSEKQLTALFQTAGGETRSRPIAKSIVKMREKEPIIQTQQLVHLIQKIYKGQRGKIHPATKVFQALRIAVNSELESIRKVLPQAFDVLQPQGRLVTISFHQGEDRIVKTFMKIREEKRQGRQITKKPIVPSLEEKKVNPSSRSAKMRVFEKIII